MFQKLARTAGPGSKVAAMAPGLSCTLSLQSGASETLVMIRDGAVTDANPGPHLMSAFTFRLAASEAEWREFLAAVPKPMHHDLFAMKRRGAVAFEGDVRVLMANLLYFKRLLTSLRPEMA